ncbi:MAG: hypothetical protein GW823_02635 [Bacteroidetes bacterium]|nr:hypothetical protein [Bacteroidota bacterium]
MSKDTNKKTRSPKKNYVLSEKEVAKLAGCSVTYVKKIREGSVDIKSPLSQRISAIDEIAFGSKNLLMEEIKRVVNL